MNDNIDLDTEKEEKKIDVSDDDYQLGGRPPLITLLIMSLGPLISQIVQALTSVIGSILVANSIGQIGVEVYGAVYTVEFFAVAIAQFLSAGISVRLSYLYGAQQLDDTHQLFVDFLRISVILGIITPCIVLPATQPAIRWFGADEETAHLSLLYMSPITGGCMFNIIFLVSSGVILADGKSVTYAVFQVVSFVLNVGIFAPILLLVIKTPIWGASLATILSQAILLSSVQFCTSQETERPIHAESSSLIHAMICTPSLCVFSSSSSLSRRLSSQSRQELSKDPKKRKSQRKRKSLSKIWINKNVLPTKFNLIFYFNRKKPVVRLY